MVQITVLIVAVGAGTFGRSWRQAWLITLIAFLVTSAIQTPMVIADDDIDSPFVYWTIQAMTLGVGVGLARALFARTRRGARRASSFFAGTSTGGIGGTRINKGDGQ